MIGGGAAMDRTTGGSDVDRIWSEASLWCAVRGGEALVFQDERDIFIASEDPVAKCLAPVNGILFAQLAI